MMIFHWLRSFCSAFIADLVFRLLYRSPAGEDICDKDVCAKLGVQVDIGYNWVCFCPVRVLTLTDFILLHRYI